MKLNRVAHLQKMVEDEKKEILKKVNRHNQAVITSSNFPFYLEKYRNYKAILQERVMMADNFIKQAADSFFTMLCDK